MTAEAAHSTANGTAKSELARGAANGQDNAAPLKVEAVMLIGDHEEDSAVINVAAAIKPAAASGQQDVQRLCVSAVTVTQPLTKLVPPTPSVAPAAAAPSVAPTRAAPTAKHAAAPLPAAPPPPEEPPAAAAPVEKPQPAAAAVAGVATDAVASAGSAAGSSSTHAEPAEQPRVAEKGLRLYPVCPGGAQSVRQKSFAPELVAAWEEEMQFSAAQQAKFSEFRRALLDEELLHECYDNKPSFYRFLQARQWDITKATLMFRNHMEWRKKKGLDDWVATDKGPVPRFMLEFKFPELASVKAAYPFSHHHVARDGRPVYYDRLGAIDYKAMIKDSSAERVLEFFVWYSEASVHYRTSAASVAAGKHICKSLFILDLKGFALTKMTEDTRAFVKGFASLASDNFPETIWKTWIINAPFIFKAAWNFVAKLLDPNTVAKFTILGGEKEYLPKLREMLDDEVIPTFVGGKDESLNFVDEKGPWTEFFPNPPYGPHLE